MWLHITYKHGGGVGVLQLSTKKFKKNLRNLSKVNFISLILCKLPWSAEHRLDGTRRQRVLPLHDELVSIRRDELHVHGVRALASPIHPLSLPFLTNLPHRLNL